MNLLIHDLTDEEWNRISGDYDGWTVVKGGDGIRPCIGCFCCWNKDPGRCAAKDGYENMGYLIHQAGEVVVISRYTYGGFSGSVKSIFDRCLGYVLPQFEVINDETHHMKRYDEDKPFTFIFYGDDLTEKEKKSADRYVRSVCTNIRGHVKDVIFKMCGNISNTAEQSMTCGKSDVAEQRSACSMPDEAKQDLTVGATSGKVVIVNGSMRNVTGNSAKFARLLKGQLSKESEIIDLKKYLDKTEELIRILEDAEIIVWCVPLYVDGLPGKVITFMEEFQSKYNGDRKKVYVLANMGLFESRQLINLFDAVRQWCGKTGLEYCGGLGISAGELLGVLSDALPMRLGPNKKVFEGMKKLASAVDSGETTEDIYAEPYLFPRSLYIHIANKNWDRTARKNGLRPGDLYRRLNE